MHCRHNGLWRTGSLKRWAHRVSEWHSCHRVCSTIKVVIEVEQSFSTLLLLLRRAELATVHVSCRLETELTLVDLLEAIVGLICIIS